MVGKTVIGTLTLWERNGSFAGGGPQYYGTDSLLRGGPSVCIWDIRYESVIRSSERSGGAMSQVLCLQTWEGRDLVWDWEGLKFWTRPRRT